MRDSVMTSGPGGRLRTPTGISVAGGCAAAVGAALVAGALFPGSDTAARAAVMSVMIGVFAATVADLVAVLAVAVVAALLFVGFLVNESGVLALPGDTWRDLVPLGAAAVLGCAWRRIGGGDRGTHDGRRPAIGCQVGGRGTRSIRFHPAQPRWRISSRIHSARGSDSTASASSRSKARASSPAP